MIEQWKRIDGYPNYEISSFGNVRRADTHNPIKNYKSNHYYIIRLYNKKYHTFMVHSLVAKAFLTQNPHCPCCGMSLEINHKDEDTYNNHSDNLEYVTKRKNVQLGAAKKVRQLKIWQKTRSVQPR